MRTAHASLPLCALAAAVLATVGASPQTFDPKVRGAATTAQGCAQTADTAREPERTDLEDDVTHYGYLRRCTDGRPAILTIDLVEYYEGAQALQEAAKDGETLEPDVDPVMYVRNRNPRLRALGVKPDATVLMFDCETAACEPRRAHLAELPWSALYRFRLQNGLIVYIELPYSP
jgi:hypothetical protein